MARMSETCTFVNVAESKDWGSAGFTGDSIHMGKGHSVTFAVNLGALTGTSILTVKSGASAGTETTSETFHYRLASGIVGAASADLFAAPTAATTLSLTDGTYDRTMLLVEVDADEVTDGQPWLTLSINSTATVLLASCTAVVMPRYASAAGSTVIA